MSCRRLVALAAAPLALTVALAAQSGSPRGGAESIEVPALKEWLGYIASDELQGREVYTEGLGLAAGYIASHLRDWGVRPGAGDGSYFQTVSVVGVRTNSRSSVTVAVNGRSRTFEDGAGITFPANMGAWRTVTGNDVMFAGYGLQLPSAGVDDYAGNDPRGKVVIWLGTSGPREAGDASTRLLLTRSRAAVDKGALAVVSPAVNFGRGGGRGASPAAPAATQPAKQPTASAAAQPSAPAAAQPAGQPVTPAATQPGGQPAAPATTQSVEQPATPAAAQPAASAPAQPAGRGQGGGRGGQPAVDFTTAQRYDQPVAPVVTADDEFFEFLFSGAEVGYSDLKARAARREPLPRISLSGVTLTFNVHPDYSVVSRRLSRNVVGVIEGTDPALKDTYVAFGAHYDHIGYQQAAPAGRGGGGQNPGGCTGQVRPEPRAGDIVNNGADDDGSGTVALLAIARAFARGPKPKRSLVFVWHTGEESGLQGSRYNADHPVVPNEKIVAQLNVDMIGRNRCDDPAEANTVYLVGSDRISTELHNVSEAANRGLARPMTLDYELNDPADPQSIYTRSDHYSYAAKGIPVIFYTTGLHKDYHYLTDEVDKIEFEKMARVTQLIHATGERLANLEHPPARDNKGPRAGKGTTGEIR
jgi:hypothetical protein